MANSSILAAFEKMWEHIVIGFNTKANTDLSNVDDTTFKDKAESAGVGGGIPIVTATSSNGTSYTATVDGVTSLDVGTRITITPNRNSASTSPTLNINSLGAKTIQMPIAYDSYSTSVGATATWLVADTPITLMYNGEYWITVDMPRASAQYLQGTVPVSSGGTGATTFTSGAAIIGNGTGAFTTRSITDNTSTSGSISANTNLITSNTLKNALNRTTSVAAADSNYSTYMARAISLSSTETTPTINGAIVWIYE